MQPTAQPAFRFAFGPRNYRLMWLGLAALGAGFITMMFGDKENYGADFVGITLGPLLLVLGFGIEFAAILVRDKSLDAGAPSGVVPGTTAATLPSESPVAAGIAPPAAPAAPAYKRL